MQLELSFPVIFKMLITGFGLAQRVWLSYFFQITSTSVVAICAVYLVLTAFKCLKLGLCWVSVSGLTIGCLAFVAYLVRVLSPLKVFWCVS